MNHSERESGSAGSPVFALPSRAGRSFECTVQAAKRLALNVHGDLGEALVLAQFGKLCELIVQTDMFALQLPGFFSFLKASVVSLGAVAKDLFKQGDLRLIQPKPKCVRPVHSLYSNPLNPLLDSCI